MHGHEQQLQGVPLQTQADLSPQGSEAGDDDRQIELLKEKFLSLNAKSCRMKDLMANRQMHENKGGPDPYEMMEGMHDAIEAMEEGDDKASSIAMYNAIFAIYESARSNSYLREFVADLFPAQRDYYKVKEEKRAINDELKMLATLYDEQELVQTMKLLKEKQEQRKAALEAKATAKAAKMAAKEDGPASKKSKK